MVSAIVPLGGLTGIAVALIRSPSRVSRALAPIAMVFAVLFGVFGAEMGGQRLFLGEAFLSVGAIVVMLASDEQLRRGRLWRAVLMVGLLAVLGVASWSVVRYSGESTEVLSVTKFTYLPQVSGYIVGIALFWLGSYGALFFLFNRGTAGAPSDIPYGLSWRAVSMVSVTGIALVAWWSFTPDLWTPGVDCRGVEEANALIRAVVAGSSDPGPLRTEEILREAQKRYRSAKCREGEKEALLLIGARLSASFPDRAEAALKEVDTLSPSVEQRIRMSDSLGWTAYTKGHYRAALAIFEKNRAAKMNNAPTRAAWIAGSYESEAACHRSLGHPDKAEALLVEALRVKRQSVGVSVQSIAQTENALARIYRERGRYDEAESLFERAREGLELSYAAAPQIADSVVGLARVYQSQLRLAEAEAMLRKALLPGGPGARRAYVLTDLADVQRDLGRAADAEALYWRALALREEDLGPQHPNVAETLIGLAQLHVSQGRFAAAEALFARALRIQRDSVGDGHPTVGRTARLQADLLRRAGRQTEADQMDEVAARAYTAWQAVR